jgi:F0F1-type ATP synthase delta subunit
LDSKINKVNIVTVYLAFEMPNEEIVKLAQNIRTTLKSTVTFLEIKKDANLLAGMALVYKGVYKDYSLRKKLEDQKEKLIMEMRRYIS